MKRFYKGTFFKKMKMKLVVYKTEYEASRARRTFYQILTPDGIFIGKT